MEKTESNNPVVTPPAEDESKKESSAEKMPPPPSRQEQANIEKAEEVKLRAKYPQVIRYYRTVGKIVVFVHFLRTILQRNPK